MSTFAEICHDFCTTKLLGYTVIGGAVAGACLYGLRFRFESYAATGPYDSEHPTALGRFCQRFLVDRSRTLFETNWFPIDAIVDTDPQRPSENGHRVSGATRDEARRAITAAIELQGLSKYELSPAVKSDNVSGKLHYHYAVADLAQAVRSDEVKPSSVIVCIDTDYYVRDPDSLFGYPNRAVIHTFNPTTVAGIDGDTPFRILDNQVEYLVSGGGEWRHQVWDWCKSGEFLEFRKPIETIAEWLLSFIGVRKYTYHKVSFARPWKSTPHRALVWLTPTAMVYRIDWLRNEIHARKLKRMNYSDKLKPTWNKLVNWDGENHTISIGRAGEDAHVELDKADFDILMGLGSQQSVTSRLLGMGYKDPRIHALLGQY